MEPIYANVILWAVFLFLSYIGYGAAIVRLLKLAEFNDFGCAAKAVAWHKMRWSVLSETGRLPLIWHLEISAERCASAVERQPCQPVMLI
jgi:hypothetical protein